VVVDLPLVECLWQDAWSDKETDVSMEDVAATHIPQLMKTVGWLLHADETGVSIVNEAYANKPHYRGRTFILKSMIVSIEPLNSERKRRAPRKRKGEATATPPEDTTA
jgi:hypothetical protein